MKRVRALSLAILFAVAAAIGSAAHAAPPPFDQWLADMKREAVAEGISPALVDSALSNLQPDPEVVRLDKPKNQPETAESLQTYVTKRVSAERIRRGREMMASHKSELERIGAQYGVAPQYIVALWGMETNYGGYTGNKEIIRSLATLAWNGRDGTSPKRAAFFRTELLAALKIIDRGHFTLADMKGSWAGAFGQVQFMPSSFLNLARDGDGDGRIDIRNNLSDAFASAANYLARNGWRDGERWGREVRLPAGFDAALVGSSKSMAEWSRLGVKTSAGSAVAATAGISGTLLAPDGVSGKVYLVYNNFRTIKRWNNSDKFAISVGTLADAIASATSTPAPEAM